MSDDATREPVTTTIDTDGAISLVVGWRNSTGKYHLQRLRLSNDVAEELRAIARKTADDIAAREPERWAPDADLSPETVLTLSLGALGPEPALTRDYRGASFIDTLRGGSELPALPPDRLPAASIGVYAIVVGNDPGNRTVMMRRSNPRRGFSSGRLLSVYRQVLEKVEAPIFGFDDLVDLVIHDDTMYVLSQTAFAALFRENETLVAQVPAWIGDVSRHVPITGDGVERLRHRALRDSRVRTRLEAIARRAHLVGVTPEQLRAAMAEHDLDAGRLLDANGQLVLEDEDVPLVLQFLNEDLFVGPLSNASFRADRKHARTR